MSLTRAFEKLSKIQEVTIEYPTPKRTQEPVRVTMLTEMDSEQKELFEALGLANYTVQYYVFGPESLDIQGFSNHCELQFNIDLTKGDLQSQWKDAVAILSQKIDSQVVDEVMAYVKQKTEWNQESENKMWESGGKTVGVGSSWGSYGIQVTTTVSTAATGTPQTSATAF